MPKVTIRKYRKTDEAAVQEITYRTGFQGEDLTGRHFFDDERLWFLIFIYYYARYEPEHFFVAVDSSTECVVGFICATPDTAAQEARFQKTVVPRIVLRTFFFTSWRYPRTFSRVLGFLRSMGSVEGARNAAALWADYPAHLHIDLLAEYQSMGIGTRLMQRLEQHLVGLNVRGLHLKTTNHNRKAVPFYIKMGLSIVDETRMDTHPLLEDLVLLTFAKTLGD